MRSLSVELKRIQEKLKLNLHEKKEKYVDKGLEKLWGKKIGFNFYKASYSMVLYDCKTSRPTRNSMTYRLYMVMCK